MFFHGHAGLRVKADLPESYESFMEEKHPFGLCLTMERTGQAGVRQQGTCYSFCCSSLDSLYSIPLHCISFGVQPSSCKVIDRVRAGEQHVRRNIRFVRIADILPQGLRKMRAAGRLHSCPGLRTASKPAPRHVCPSQSITRLRQLPLSPTSTLRSRHPLFAVLANGEYGDSVPCFR